jgi:PIN domain nuclease of toxin-antitoxin system
VTGLPTTLTIVDTHAAVWMTQQQDKLSGPAQKALLAGRMGAGLAIADITLREMAFLARTRRLTLDRALEDYLRFVELHFKVLPVNAEIALRSIRFGPSYPKDPADCLIGATAIVYGGRLVTKDEGIRRSKEVDCVW